MVLDNSTTKYFTCVQNLFQGPCDRRASHIKSCIQGYVNEGHGASTAEEMKVVIHRNQNDIISLH